MARTIWDWLEIEETRDKALIRKAYASQAKKYHPEDMPEEAKQLREAYKRALALAERHKDIGSSRHYEEHREESENTGEDRRYSSEIEKILLEHADVVYRYHQETQQEEMVVPPEKIDNGYHYEHENHEIQREERKVLTDNTDNGYQYSHESKKETYKVPSKSTQNSYQYHLDVQREEYKNLRSSGHFDHFQFDETRVRRLELLEERMNDLYCNEGQRDFILWSDTIKKYLTIEDLKDAHVIAAILSILIQMRRLSYPVWEILEQELFCYRGDGAEWDWLQAQLMKMREEDSAFKKLRTQVKQKGMVGPQINPITGKIIPKEPVPEEHNALFGILLFLFCVLVYFLILFLISVL